MAIVEPVDSPCMRQESWALFSSANWVRALERLKQKTHNRAKQAGNKIQTHKRLRRM